MSIFGYKKYGVNDNTRKILIKITLKFHKRNSNDFIYFLLEYEDNK